MSSIVVKNKEELEKAKNGKVKEIIIVGELASNINRSKKIIDLGDKGMGVALATGVVMGVSLPFTAGITVLAAPVATVIGAGAITSIAGSITSISLQKSIFKEYKEIESGKNGDEIYIRLLRKKVKNT